MKILSVLIIFLWSFPGAHAAPFCQEQNAYGIPAAEDIELCRQGYAVGFNAHNKIPDWVAFRLTRESVSPYEDRSRHTFGEDPQVSQDVQASDNSYRHSGYDRGHMAPAASMDFSDKSLYQSYFYTNVAPQRPGLNRKGWFRLEKESRQYAKRFGVVYVVVGPYSDPSVPHTYLRGGVLVPDAFFFVLISPKADIALAYLMPNKNVPMDEINKYETSIHYIEKLTGFDFFRKLSGNIANDLESRNTTVESQLENRR